MHARNPPAANSILVTDTHGGATARPVRLASGKIPNCSAPAGRASSDVVKAPLISLAGPIVQIDSTAPLVRACGVDRRSLSVPALRAHPGILMLG